MMNKAQYMREWRQRRTEAPITGLCKTCGAKRDFYKNVCRACDRVRQHDYRKNNPEHVRTYTDRARAKAYARMNFLYDMFGRRCRDCGHFPHTAAMDFHHLRDKEFCVNVRYALSSHVQLLLNEAAKCELLCSNCHRIRHAKGNDDVVSV